MQRNFGVALDVSEINHCIGSKTALAMLPACFVNPGDVTLMTVPGYPVAGTHTRYYGGARLSVAVAGRERLLAGPGFDSRRRAVASQTVGFELPQQPNGQGGDTRVLPAGDPVAQDHQIVVVQDAAHLMLTFEGAPLSFLSVPGARDVGVEVHSLSKGFDMIGWRIGWVCGNRRIVQAFADVKDNCDSGQFIAIQKAAITALDDAAIPDRTNAKYRRRLGKLVATLSACGFDCRMPGGSYFLYTRAPRAVRGVAEFRNAEDASQYLITELSMVTVPWDDAGAYLRFSATYEAVDDADEDRIMEETRRRLSDVVLEF